MILNIKKKKKSLIPSWNYLITQTTRSLFRSTEARILVSYTVSFVQSKAQRNPVWLSQIKMKEKKRTSSHTCRRGIKGIRVDRSILHSPIFLDNATHNQWQGIHKIHKII